MTLDQLNNMFDEMQLGYQDDANRPGQLKESLFNGNEKYKLKQTAEQSRIFLKYLLFVLKHFVPNDGPHYKLVLQVSSIVQTCF